MSKQVTVTTKSVGTNFGVVGVVKTTDGRALHTTDTKPHGMSVNARRAAELWAEKNGYSVVEPR